MAGDYLQELNEEQRRAVLHDGTPLLILAGAGSGKTKTLTYKAAHLIHSGKVTPDGILLVTFTNKAAAEMRERVNRVTEVTLPYVSTFHSLSARLLRKEARTAGLSPDFVIYDDEDQESLVKDILGGLNLDPKRFKPRMVMGAISGAKQELVDPVRYNALARGPFQEAVASVYTKYQKQLTDYGALDFDDLMGRLIEVFREHPNVLDKYQRQFQYIFVDEYQDTNTAQYLLTTLLAKHHGRLTVVGDASQSIYRWRGADYRNMQKLKTDFPTLTEIRLERNYRSTQTILDAAHAVIGNNQNHPVLALWTDSGSGEKIHLIEAYSGADEAERITTEIMTLKAQGRRYQDIALLYRTNAQSRSIEEAFIRTGIPYILIGGTKFYERKEVKDVLAYIRLVLNPLDGVSYKRAEKIGKRKLAQVLVLADTLDVHTTPPAKILERILEESGYLAQFDEEIEEELARIENVKELVSVASEFTDVASFLENVALVQSEYFADEKKGAKTARDAVTLMTLHASKGLEFPVVFLIGLEEGLFPHSRALMDQEEMEEERRLMYVGITRAKELLYLSYAKQRTVWGTTGSQQKSRFIDEIDPSLIKVSASVGRGYGSSHTGGDVRAGEGSLDEEKAFWRKHAGSGSGREIRTHTKKSGIRIDSLSDSTLDDFLTGEISVDELLNR
jgi:DNA helicase-2/ATP-dependent DNA helicase PcrA